MTQSHRPAKPEISKKVASISKVPAILLAGVVLGWSLLVLAIYYYPTLWQPLLRGEWQQTFQAIEGSGFFHLKPGAMLYWSEAAARAVSGVGGAIFLLASAAALGWLISQAARWRFDNRLEAGPFVVALGIGGLAYIGLALALVGLYRAEVLWSVAGLSLAGGLVVFLRARRRPRPQWHRPLRLTWLWIGCASLAVLMTFVAALAPQWEYDGVWYHLYFPRLYLEQGHLVDLVDEFPSLFPMTWELWFGYGLAVGGQTAATLLHFVCLVLLAMMTYELTRRYLPAVSPWLAVALFVSAPLVMWTASTAYIDLAGTLYIILALYATLRYTDGRLRQWLWLAAVNLGLALAIKHVALLVAPLLGGGLTLLLWLEARRLPMPVSQRLWQAVSPALLLGTVSLLIALPWYWRSWAASGDPLFPMLFSLVGAPAERWDALSHAGLMSFEELFGRPRTFWNQLTLPWHVTMHAAAYDGSLGPLFLVLLPLLILRPKGRVIWWLLAFVLAYMAAWASPLGEFELRWLIPVVPLFGVLGAAAFTRLAALVWLVAGRWAVWTLSGGLAFLLLLNLPPFTPFHQRDLKGWDGWLNNTLHGLPLRVVFGLESADDFLAARINTYAGWQFVNQHTSADARFLTWTGGDHFYSYRDRLNALAPGLRPLAWAEVGQEEQVLLRLRQFGITHLLLDQDYFNMYHLPAEDGWDNYAATGPTTRSKWYDIIYQDERATVYRIRWEELTESAPEKRP